ncbi:MAG: dihydrodipicolinate synthase family protein [Bryobacterales bacterium]|nr:dihydrodipicolinate synthase family protein [Bryobacterales bacterium]
MKPVLEGMMPAVVTPLDGSGGFRADSFEKLLEKTYRAGVAGVYVCGNTGEGPQLHLSVRKAAAEAAVRSSPAAKAVIVHTGAASTEDALELTRHAAKAGAHAVSSMPPSPYYSFEEIRAYYQAIAEASELPVLVYYIPSVSTTIRTLDQIFDLCSIPNVIGLKFTDYDLYKMSLISRAGHVIFNGSDEVAAAGLLMGATGGIGTFYCLIPELFVGIYQHGRAGRFDQARKLQDRANDLIRAVLKFPPLSSVKLLLKWSGIDCGATVRPRRALSAQEQDQLRIAVREAGFEPDGFLKSPSLAAD